MTQDDIMSYLSQRSDRKIGPTELAKALGKSKSTIHDELKLLVKKGRIIREPSGRYYVEVSHDDWKESARHKHSDDLLPVFQLWAQSRLDVPARFGPLKITGTPESEECFREARDDLQCYPAYTFLSAVERSLDGINKSAEQIRNNLQSKIERLTAKHRLRNFASIYSERAKGWTGMEEGLLGDDVKEEILSKGRWHCLDVDQLITLIEADREPHFRFQDGYVILESSKGAEEKKVAGRFSGTEGEIVVTDLQLLWANLSPEFLEEVKSVLSKRSHATKDYQEFIKRLQRDTIKLLRYHIPIPGGGRCSICREIRGRRN